MITFNGILAALAVITLFIATILPTSRISLYALSSFFVSIVIIHHGIRSGWMFYMATCLLAFLVVQIKIRLLPYVVFFGIYGIVKYYIERLNNIILEYVFKLLYFNTCLIVSVLVYKELFLGNITVEFPWWILAVALQLVFVVYDYIYTRFIQYYNYKLRPALKL